MVQLYQALGGGWVAVQDSVFAVTEAEKLESNND